MELKDFINHTIAAIADGIIESQDSLKSKGVIVNPKMTTSSVSKSAKIYSATGSSFVQDLDFEVQVIVEESSGNSAEAKIKVFNAFQLGGGADSASSLQNKNKISFTIPVVFPNGDSKTK